MPWADDSTVSLLATPQHTREVVKAAGFVVRVWEQPGPGGVRYADVPDQPPVQL